MVGIWLTNDGWLMRWGLILSNSHRGNIVIHWGIPINQPVKRETRHAKCLQGLPFQNRRNCTYHSNGCSPTILAQGKQWPLHLCLFLELTRTSRVILLSFTISRKECWFWYKYFLSPFTSRCSFHQFYPSFSQKTSLLGPLGSYLKIDMEVS